MQTVYGWVPSQVILKVIESHGGLVGGELPEMVPDSDHYEDPEQGSLDAVEALQ